MTDFAAMRLYDGGKVPNARRVRMFLNEKGISIPLVPVDIGRMEHHSASFTALNPLQRVPVLELPDGRVLTESVAICRFIERLAPEPALFGTGAYGEAEVEMWNRRLEFDLYLPVQAAFRHLHPAMAGYEVPQIAEWGEVNKPRALDMLAFLDQALAHRPFIAGDSLSIADITAFVTISFLKPAKLVVPESLTNLARWRAAMAERPSATA